MTDPRPHHATLIAQHLRDGVLEFRKAAALLGEHFPEEGMTVSLFAAGIDHLDTVADRMDLIALDAELDQRISFDGDPDVG